MVKQLEICLNVCGETIGKIIKHAYIDLYIEKIVDTVDNMLGNGGQQPINKSMGNVEGEYKVLKSISSSKHKL